MTGGMMFKGEQWVCEHGSDDYFYVTHKDGVSFSKDERVSAEYLIAAAPELLEATHSLITCLEMIDEKHWCEYDHVTSVSLQDARAAIAKALGEQK